MPKKGTTKYKSNKQEKSVAKQFGGRQVIASGSLWFADSDVRNDKFLIECKTTEKDYYTLTAKVWEKIEREAIKDRGRIPLMIIDLEDKDRMVVFKPKDFVTDIPSPYDCTAKSLEEKDLKSYRVSLKELLEAEECFGEYIYGKLFLICGDKRTMLVFMRIKDFEEVYRSELV